MSYLLLVLYYYFDGYESFVYLSNLIIGNEFMRGLYTFDMKGVHSYCQLMDRLLRKEAPELFEYFDLHGISTMSYAVDWFYTLFSRAFDIGIVRVVWDLFLLLGPEFLVRAAVAMLLLLKDELMGGHAGEGFNFVRVKTGKLKVSRIVEISLKRDYSHMQFIQLLEELYSSQQSAERGRLLSATVSGEVSPQLARP